MKSKAQRLLICRWIVLGILTIPFSIAQGATSSVLGDVSGDGTVSMYDAALVARYVQGLINLTPTQLANADVEGDGNIGLDDANLIAQMATGLIQQFPSKTATYTFSTSAGLSGTIGVNGISSMTLNGMTVIKPGSSWQEANPGAINGTCPSGTCITECGDNATLSAYGANLTTAQCDINGGASMNYPYPNEISFATDPNTRNGTPSSSTIEQVDANDFIVTHTYPNAKFTYTYNITGEDVTISTRVDNNSTGQYFYNLLFRGMGIPFSSPLGDELLTRSNMEWWWDINYLGINGRQLFHPSGWSPIGAWVINNNFFGVSIMPMDEQGQRNIVMGDTIGHPNSVADDRYPIYLLAQENPIAPGASATNTLVMRFSNNINFTHLMAPYKANFIKDLPVAQYQPDVRPIGYTDESDPSYISANDPYGYYPMSPGNSGRQWDIAASCTDYLSWAADPLEASGGQGSIFWAPQGWSWQGSPMFTPAMDQFPPVPLTNINNILIPGYTSRNLKFGLEDRPDLDNTYGPWQQLSANDPKAMATLLGRFKTTTQMGVQLYYLDSFGSNINDQQIMKAIRGQVGNNVLTYTEDNSDEILPYTGFYTEYQVATVLQSAFTQAGIGGDYETLVNDGFVNSITSLAGSLASAGTSSITLPTLFPDDYPAIFSILQQSQTSGTPVLQSSLGVNGQTIFQTLVNNSLVTQTTSGSGTLTQAGVTDISQEALLQTDFPNDYTAITNILIQSQLSGAPGVIYDTIPNRSLAIYQWLVPQGVYVANMRDNNLFTPTEAWTWVYQHRLTPLVFDCSISACTNFNEEGLFDSLNAQYINPQTHTWNANAFPSPTTPANFSAQAVSSTQVNLNWSTVSSNDFNYYVIERSMDNGTTWGTVVTRADNEPNFTPSYSDTGLNPSTMYTYRIKAYNDFTGDSPYSSLVSVNTPS